MVVLPVLLIEQSDWSYDLLAKLHFHYQALPLYRNVLVQKNFEVKI